MSRKVYKLEVKEDFVDGVSEFYLTLPDKLCYQLELFPGDTIDCEVNGDSVLIYKDPKS